MILRLLFILFLAHGLFAAEIPAGTHVALRSEQMVRSDTAKVGDRVHFRTTTPVSDGQRIVVPAGSYLEAEVLRAKQSGRLRGRAELEIGAKRLIFIDGRARPLPFINLAAYPATPVHRAISGRLIWAAALIAIFVGNSVEYGPHREFSILAGAATALAASVALQRGGEVEIRAGTVLDVYFDQAVPLD